MRPGRVCCCESGIAAGGGAAGEAKVDEGEGAGATLGQQIAP